MPRSEEPVPRLYVGHLAFNAREIDVEREFKRYGRIKEVDLKRGYGFVEYLDPRDAEDARRGMDRRNICGTEIRVQFAVGKRDRGPPPSSQSRRGLRNYSQDEYEDRGRLSGPYGGRDARSRRRDVCFNCGMEGHYARNCREGDWKNRCFTCGEIGHKKLDCSKYRRGRRSRSTDEGRRSLSRSPSPHSERERSRSRSRSPAPKRRGRSPNLEYSRRSASPEPRYDHKENPSCSNQSEEGLRESSYNPLRDYSADDGYNGRELSPIMKSEGDQVKKKINFLMKEKLHLKDHHNE